MAKFSTSERNDTGKRGHKAQKRAHTLTHIAHSKQGQVDSKINMQCDKKRKQCHVKATTHSLPKIKVKKCGVS
jgi:hypothetical protein